MNDDTTSNDTTSNDTTSNDGISNDGISDDGISDDTYCLFIIVACLTTLVVPDAGQVIVAAFAFALAVLAQLTPKPGSAGRPGHRDRHNVVGR